jgi:hypothetical protein
MIKRKIFKKIVVLLGGGLIGGLAFAWVYGNYFMSIDTAEVDKYYDLLSKIGNPSQDLVLHLGATDGNTQTIVNRLKQEMGLEEHEIWIGHHSATADSRPAFVTNMKGTGVLGISVSDKNFESREEISIMVHELGHMYVWKIDRSLLADCDEEKVVDTAGIFLGLGILVLNGMTDDTFFLGGTEYAVEKKFYGYLKPIEFGYLFARYCTEHGIDKNNVIPFLGPEGRKYFNLGLNHIKRQNNIVEGSAGTVMGAYWCPECGQFSRVSLSGDVRKHRCPRCSRSL